MWRIATNANIYRNITLAKEKQKKKNESRKRKNVKSFYIQQGDEVLKADMRKLSQKGLHASWTGPYRVVSVSEKGVAKLFDERLGIELHQGVSVAQLKPYYRRESGELPALHSEGQESGNPLEGDLCLLSQIPLCCVTGTWIGSVRGNEGEVESERDATVQVPSVVRGLQIAKEWIDRHRSQLRGYVLEPSYFQMEAEDRQDAVEGLQRDCEEVCQGDAHDSRGFTFTFQYKVDFNRFLDFAYKQGFSFGCRTLEEECDTLEEL